MNKIKVIFLDVDGVLNRTGCTNQMYEHYFIMPEKIFLLKQLVDESKAKLVLTSSWRLGWYDIEKGETRSLDARLFSALQEKFHENELGLFSKTPILNGVHRGIEIDSWLKTWKGDHISSFVILDDMNSKYLRPHSARHVRTSFTQGLLAKHILKAQNILNIPYTL